MMVWLWKWRRRVRILIRVASGALSVYQPLCRRRRVRAFFHFCKWSILYVQNSSRDRSANPILSARSDCSAESSSPSLKDKFSVSTEDSEYGYLTQSYIDVCNIEGKYWCILSSNVFRWAKIKFEICW